MIMLSRFIMIYTTQTLISIKTIFLITGHTDNLTKKILVNIYSRTSVVHLFFSSCLRALLTDLQKRWNTPEIEVVSVFHPIQFCLSSPLTGPFTCKTVLKVEMSILLCLKCTFGKFQKSVIVC